MIGYCVPINPKLASFRLRVALPSRYLNLPHVIGGIGDVTFMFKNGNPALARKLSAVVYDVVNPHFDDPDYRLMCDIAKVVTCSSDAMRGIIKREAGRDAVVIPDPYENALQAPSVSGERVVWFGHQANIKSLEPYRDLDISLCTAECWSMENEAKALESAGVVLLTGSNPGASTNRLVKAIRAGRFAVAPEDSPSSWRELSEFIWMGDVREGIKWAFQNREEACRKVLAGQQYIASRFSPQLIGSQWADLFGSISAAVTNKKTAGSGSISR